MKAYKGFNADMTCRGFQYEIGKEYETEKARLCNEGFHACENPLDCFKYYSPSTSRYCEVEIEDNGERKEDDSKVVGTKIKIGAELSVAQICKAHFDFVKSKCVPSKSNAAGDNESASAGWYGSASAGYKGTASAGECGSASAGWYGSASAGYKGTASAGECGSASAGECGSASAGEYGSASAGWYGTASAGEYGSASAGWHGSASAGECGSAVSRGSSSVGKNGVAVVRGINIKAKGGIGSLLVLYEENADNYNVKEWKAVVVDGEKVKADTYYTIKDGELVEVK